jgi:hypothetical protein
MRRRIHTEDLGVDGRIILIWILGKESVKGAEWIHLAQDRDQGLVPVNMVMKFRVHKRRVIFN